MDTFFKQSHDKLDYDTDFSRWLPDGDVVQLSEVTTDSPPGVLVVEAVQHTDQIVKVWLSGGVNGSTYQVTVLVTTAGGRIKETEFKLRVRDY